MDEREFKAIKARIAYEVYISRLPKCDKCESCMFVSDRKNASDRRVYTERHEIIDNRVITCPSWCPKREGNKNGE